MQIHKCDVCGILGEPGVRWIRVNISPFTIQNTQPNMEVPYYEELYMDVCSIECVRDKLLDYDFVTDNRKSLCKANVTGRLSPSPVLPTDDAPAVELDRSF